MRAINVFLVIMLSLASCHEQNYDLDQTTVPTFNIWGHVTGNIPSGEPVLLYKVNNTTLEYQLTNLRYLEPVQYAWTETDGIFRFHNLSTGTYCILILAISFGGTGGQGFPYIEEYWYSNYSITQAWAGGNKGHSLGVIQIKPADPK